MTLVCESPRDFLEGINAHIGAPKTPAELKACALLEFIFENAELIALLPLHEHGLVCAALLKAHTCWQSHIDMHESEALKISYALIQNMETIQKVHLYFNQHGLPGLNPDINRLIHNFYILAICR